MPAIPKDELLAAEVGNSVSAPLIGVLAMQSVREHVTALELAGARTRLVRLADLDGLDGLVIPGGESTTMQILLERMG